SLDTPHLLLFFLLSPQPPRSTLFPYTTLFRSAERTPDFPFVTVSPLLGRDQDWDVARLDRLVDHVTKTLRIDPARVYLTGLSRRSEEHTSELQSRENLVCRLLLEKKKIDKASM